MSGVVQRVDESVDSTPEDEYKSLLRSLRRRKGFGLTFVRCSPAGGVEVIQKVRDDLPQKQIGVLELQQPIDNLIERVESFPNQENLNILFVVGLEKSLEEYIRSGYGGEGDYYNLDGIPPILNHLNWQRENFRDKFRHICFVFLLPQFAIKYISRRAPDFFDWGTGVFEFKDKEILDLSYPRNLAQRELNQKLSVIYPLITLVQIILIIISTIKYIPLYIVLIVLFGIIVANFWQLRNNQLLVDIPLKEFTVEVLQKFPLISFTRSNIYVRQGNMLVGLGRYEEAISCYDMALQLNSNCHEAWHKKGHLFDDLHRYKEAFDSYDKALQIKSKDINTLYFRGVVLFKLGRYEEAIISFDKALQVKSILLYLPIFLRRYLPSISEENIWYFRGMTLGCLRRYEQEILSYDKGLQINPNDYYIWENRGHALYELGRNQEAVNSYKKALQINPNSDKVWFFLGSTLDILGRHEEAINSYKNAIQINHQNIYAWSFQGILLDKLGRYEEAINSYEKALQINPCDHREWRTRSIILKQLGRYKEAILSYDNALKYNSDYLSAYYGKARICSLQNNIETAVYNLQKVIQTKPEIYRELAITEPDFDNIRHDPRFQALIQ